MVNWYRAIVRDRPTPATETVEVPTLVIWGAKDRFLSTRLAGESVDRCADGRLLILDTATHWVVRGAAPGRQGDRRPRRPASPGARE